MHQMEGNLPSLIALVFQKWKYCSLNSEIPFLAFLQQRWEEQIAETIPALGGKVDG
jgi:hypothetical protein